MHEWMNEWNEWNEVGNGMGRKKEWNNDWHLNVILYLITHATATACGTAASAAAFCGAAVEEDICLSYNLAIAAAQWHMPGVLWMFGCFFLEVGVIGFAYMGGTVAEREGCLRFWNIS